MPPTAQYRRTRNLFAIIATLLAHGLSAPAPAQTADDLCNGDPCVISGDEELGGAEVDLDFGERSVVLRAVLDAGGGSVTIHAGSFTMEPLGQLLGTDNIALDVTGDVLLDGTRSRGAVRMVEEDGGSFTVLSHHGSVRGSGKLVLSSNSSEGDGGSLTILAAVDVALSGSIEAVGGIEGGGGEVEIGAGGDVFLSGPIDLSGGGFDGGTLDVEALGSIELGQVVLDGSGDLGSGGDIDLSAGDDVLLAGIVQSRGSGAGSEECGDGGLIDIVAGGTLTVAAKLDASARASSCWGGELDFDANAVEIQSEIVLRGVGSDGRGGELAVRSEQPFTCSTTVDFSGSALGGFVVIDSDDDVILTPACNLDGAGAGAGVELVAADDLVVGGTVRVGSTSPGAARGPARISAVACSLLLDQTARLTSVGAGADNAFTIAGNVVLRGSLVAGGANSFMVPTGLAPVVLGAVTPPPSTTFDPKLRPCGAAVTPTAAPPTVQPPATPTIAVTPTPDGATPGETSTPTPTATRTVDRGCFGDCNGDGSVGIAELVRLTNIALGRPLTCDFLVEGEKVGIPFLIRAVRSSLDGCS